MSASRIALYAGSFNPFHVGHLDILRQAEKIFDKVVIGVGKNGAKGGDADAAQMALSQIGLPNLIITIKGTITETMKTHGITTLVRGVRNNEDLLAEAHMGRYLRDLLPGINIIYLFPNPEVAHVSSSAVRELIQLNTADSLVVANRYLVKNMGHHPANLVGGGHSSQANGVYSAIQPVVVPGPRPEKPVVKSGTGMFASLTRKPE